MIRNQNPLPRSKENHLFEKVGILEDITLGIWYITLGIGCEV